MIKDYRQYRDDALAEIITYELRRAHHGTALVIAQKISEAEFRAINLLRIANSIALTGDGKAAREVAANVMLPPRFSLSHDRALYHVDFHQPNSWNSLGCEGITSSSRFHYSRRRAEIASLAMTMAIRLREEPTESYADSFKEIRDGESFRAIARAHAKYGDPKKALEWAERVPPEGETGRISNRIEAILGVAEGILDRSSERKAETLPKHVRIKLIGYGRDSLRRCYRDNGSLCYWQRSPFE